MKKIKIAFDIGGVISKYPEVMRSLMLALDSFDTTHVYVITDQRDKNKVMDTLARNGFDFLPAGRVYCADYRTHGESCKAVLCEELGIDILIDDHPGYVCLLDSPPLRLLVMPDLNRPYYADEWKTDGSDGDFGRRTGSATRMKKEIES